jgi:hypothetical protein
MEISFMCDIVTRLDETRQYGLHHHLGDRRRVISWRRLARHEEPMVLTKSELIASLQNEVRILLHLASKIDRARLDYRPTPKRGSFIVNQVLCGCAAYRTQLFLYLKAWGREELGTMNLWAGADAEAAG